MSEPGKIKTNLVKNASIEQRFNAREYRMRMVEQLHKDVLDSLKDGMRFSFTEKNRYPNDRWLLFGDKKTIGVKLTRGNDDVWMVHVKGEEPIRLEDTPNNFWASIRKHIQEKRYKL